MRLSLPGACLLLALPAASSAHAQGAFDGRWSVTRSMPRECGQRGHVFTIRIKGGSVTAARGTGSVSPSGAISFPGEANNFTGTLSGNSGSGSYTGKCAGTWTARRG